MIRHTEISESGVPVYSFREGGVAVVTTTGASSSSVKKSLKKTNFGSVLPDKKEYTGSGEWVPWGSGDNFPDKVFQDVRKSGVAQAALRLLNLKLFGQQVVPVIEEGLDENLQMKYTIYKDAEVSEFLKRSNFDMWRLKVIQDYNYLANSFPMVMMNEDRSKIVKLGHDKARKFRYEPYNQATGRIDHVIRSANFPSPGEDEKEKIAVINSMDWFEEVDRIKHVDKGLKYVFPTYFPDPQWDYYSQAYWDGVRANGWLEISNSIPEYKRAIFANQSSIKYHVKIPMTYWTFKYPKWSSMKPAEREKVVNDQLDEMDKYLTGSQNAMKTFVSFYEINKQTGKGDAQIEIEPIDDKLKSDAYLPDGAAANAEILFSMLVNPAIFGLGVPGSSSYTGSVGGGSDIRESWLVMNAVNAADRMVIYQVFDFVREYNGWNPDLKLITLDKVLTTTDTGKGSKIVS